MKGFRIHSLISRMFTKTLSIFLSISLSLSLSVFFFHYNETCMYYFITFLARVSLKLYKLFTHIVQIIPETGNDFHISF